MKKLFLVPIREDNNLSVSTLALVKGGAVGGLEPQCTTNSCKNNTGPCAGVNTCTKNTDTCGTNECGVNCTSYQIPIEPCKTNS